MLQTEQQQSKMFLVAFFKLKAAMAPVQRPIIKLPQYNDMNGAISDSLYPPNSGVFTSDPKLL